VRSACGTRSSSPCSRPRCSSSRKTADEFRWGNQQAHHETVRRPLRVLLLLVLALLGALCFFAADDRVFGELTLLATVGLIDVEDERRWARFHFRQLGTKLAEEIAAPPRAASQESTDLSAMPRIGSNSAGNTGG